MSDATAQTATPALIRTASTFVSAVLLMVSIGLPLTRQGIGSATSSIDLLRLGASLGDPSIAWASRLVAVAIAGGIPLGVALLLPSRSGMKLWWCSVGLILGVGAALAVLLRGNLGTGSLLILSAGVVPVLANRLAAKFAGSA